MADGDQAKLLDLLEIALLHPLPSMHQRENHVIDATRRWRRVGRGTWKQVLTQVDYHAGPLWRNGCASWGHSNNRVSEGDLADLDGPLLLLRPEQLRISVGRKGGMFEDAEDRVVKVQFRHSGTNYVVSVTDPVIEARMRGGEDRSEDLDGAVLCLSLGRVYQGHAYKLVAAVITPTTCE